MQVNSAHHQAVAEAAPGLTVNALAPDGVIEGIEDPAHRWFIGVQWHPEYAIDPGDALNLPIADRGLRALVPAAGQSLDQFGRQSNGA